MEWAPAVRGSDWIVHQALRSEYTISMPEKWLRDAAKIFSGRLWVACMPRDTEAMASLFL